MVLTFRRGARFVVLEVGMKDREPRSGKRSKVHGVSRGRVTSNELIQPQSGETEWSVAPTRAGYDGPPLFPWLTPWA